MLWSPETTDSLLTGSSCPSIAQEGEVARFFSMWVASNSFSSQALREYSRNLEGLSCPIVSSVL